jgi:hypothetical protein
MSQPSAQLLERLQGVRPTGHGRWIARCPAHDDKRPSLSIREGDTGAVLVYCWGGCTLAEIAAAAGLNLADLFPSREPDTDQGSKWKPWRRKLASSLSPLVIRYQSDLILVQLFLADIAAGKPIAPLDRETARAAAARIWDALHEAQHVVA